MAERPPIDTSVRRGRGLTPVAYPNQQGVPFGRDPEADRLAQLAQGLSELAPALQRFAIQHQQIVTEKTRKKATEEAQRDFTQIRDAQQEYTEARASGEIRANQDPFYLKFYDDTMGMLLAQHYFSDWTEARAQSLKDATSLAEYDAEHALFIDGRIEEMFADEKVPESFLTSWSQLLAGDRRAWASQAAARLEGKVDEVAYANSSYLARNAVAGNREYGEVVADLRAMIDQRFSLEGDAMTPDKRQALGRVFVKGFLDGVAVVARDPRYRGRASQMMYDVLSNLPWGPGSVAIDVYAIGQMVEDTEARLRVNESEADTRHRRVSQEEIGQTMSGLLMAAIEGKSQEEIDTLLSSASTSLTAGHLHADSVGELGQFIRGFADTRRSLDVGRDFVDDNEFAIASFYDRALEPGAQLKDLVTHLSNLKNGQQISNDTFAQLFRFADGLFGTGPESASSKFLNSKAYTLARDYIANIVQAQRSLLMNVMGHIPQDQAELEARAHIALARFAIQWKRDNPTASDDEAMDALSERARILVIDVANAWPEDASLDNSREKFISYLQSGSMAATGAFTGEAAQYLLGPVNTTSQGLFRSLDSWVNTRTLPQMDSDLARTLVRRGIPFDEFTTFDRFKRLVDAMRPLYGEQTDAGPS